MARLLNEEEVPGKIEIPTYIQLRQTINRGGQPAERQEGRGTVGVQGKSAKWINTTILSILSVIIPIYCGNEPQTDFNLCRATRDQNWESIC